MCSALFVEGTYSFRGSAIVSDDGEFVSRCFR